MEVMPQLWDLASQLEPDPDAVDVAEVAAAEHARVTFADRLRGCRGESVRVRLATGTPVVGVLVAVHGDGIVIEDPHATWVLPMTSITRLDAHLRAPATARGRERGHVLAAVRDLLGVELVVATADQTISRVRVVAVAADHLVVAGEGTLSGLIPWEAVAWLRSG